MRAKSYGEFLLEIGDASSASYPYEITLDTDLLARYEFETEEDRYNCDFKLLDVGNTSNARDNSPDEIYDVEYYVVKNTNGTKDFSVTNRGRVFKIMSTVTRIVSDFLTRHKNASLRFEGIREKDETRYDYGDTSKRDRLYLEFLKRHLTDRFEIIRTGEYTYVATARVARMLENMQKIIKLLGIPEAHTTVGANAVLVHADIDLSGSDLTRLPDCLGYARAEYLKIDNSRIESLQNCPDVDRISADGSNLRTLSGAPSQLQQLDVSECKNLHDFSGLEHCTNLLILKCDKSGISSFAGLPATVGALEARECKIQSLEGIPKHFKGWLDMTGTGFTVEDISSVTQVDHGITV